MTQSASIDMKQLWDRAREGASADELMEEFNLADTASLKNNLQILMQEKQQEINVPGLIGAGSLSQDYTAQGVRVPSEMNAAPDDDTCRKPSGTDKAAGDSS